jgi:hypothetical protein
LFYRRALLFAQKINRVVMLKIIFCHDDSEVVEDFTKLRNPSFKKTKK